MQSQADPFAAAAQDAPSGVPDAVRAERQLEVLDDLMQAGRRLALAIEAQGTQVDAPRVVEGDVALAFDRVARAVRMTAALQARLIEDRQAREAGRASRARDEAAAARFERRRQAEERKASVERLVWRTVTAEHHDSDDETFDTVERLYNEAVERLEDEDLFDILAQPVSETIAMICRDLGLSPDWASFADEPWARAEIASGQVGAPFAHLSPAHGGGGPRCGAGGARQPIVTSPEPFPAGGEGEGPRRPLPS